jgi:hypothetical protein
VKNLIIFATILTAAGPALADQCAWNDLAIARRGAALVKTLAGITGEEPSVYTLCEPCGQTVSQLTRVKIDKDATSTSGLDVTYKKVRGYAVQPAQAPTYWEFTMNAKSAAPQSQDLAYLYVKTAANVYANVATLVNCPVDGVTPVIYTGQ